MSKKHAKSGSLSAKGDSHRRPESPGRNLTWLWISLGAVVVVIAGVFLLNPEAAPPVAITPTPSVEINPAQAYARYQQGAFFLDVRSQAEWDQFHIAGSTLIPLDQLQDRLAELPGNREIVVVCLSGHRSRSGTAILQQAGFPHVFCLSGGLQAWMAQNYPVEQGAP